MTSHFYLQLVFRLLLHLRKYSGDERTSRLTASMQLLLLLLFVERGRAFLLYKKRRRYNKNNTSTQKVKNITSKCNQYSLLHTTVNGTKMHEARWISFRCITDAWDHNKLSSEFDYMSMYVSVRRREWITFDCIYYTLVRGTKQIFRDEVTKIFLANDLYWLPLSLTHTDSKRHTHTYTCALFHIVAPW